MESGLSPLYLGGIMKLYCYIVRDGMGKMLYGEQRVIPSTTSLNYLEEYAKFEQGLLTRELFFAQNGLQITDIVVKTEKDILKTN